MTPMAFVDRDERALPRGVAEARDRAETTSFARPSRATSSGVQELWETHRAPNPDDIYLGAYEGWYCVGCEEFKTEKELVQPGNICPLHHEPVERVKEETYFFRLSRYADDAPAPLRGAPGFHRARERAATRCISFVEGGLKDLSISRTKLHLGHPGAGRPEARHVRLVRRAHELLDGAPGRGRAPRRSGATRAAIVHLVGKDILRFHAVYWPAILMSAGLAAADHGLRARLSHLQRAEDEQIAPQRGRAARHRAAFGEVVGQRRGRRRRAPLPAPARDRLRPGRGLRSRRDDRAVQRRPRQEPRQPPGAHAGPLREDDGGEGARARASGRRSSTELHAALEGALARGARGVGRLEPHRALERTWAIASAANQYVDRAAPWAEAKKGDHARVETILDTLLAVLGRALGRDLAGAADEERRDAAQLGLAPVARGEGKDWLAAPAVEARRRRGAGAGGRRSSRRSTRPGEGAAGGADAEGVEAARHRRAGAAPARRARPRPRAALAPGSARARAPATAITYDQFAPWTCASGVVKTCERVPKKDKLLKLAVDVGEAEPRTIVAGLALSFQPEELVGRKVIVVANLAPREFGKGLVSHGMLLATGPEREAHAGDRRGRRRAGRQAEVGRFVPSDPQTRSSLRKGRSRERRTGSAAILRG